MYIIEASGTNTARTVQLPKQNYDVVTLGIAIETALNGAGKTVAGAYTVAHNSSKNNYTITLAGGGTFRYVSLYMLGSFQKSKPGPTTNDWIAAGEPLGVDDLMGLRNEIVYVLGATLETGHVDIRNVHQLFLHSSTLTSYNTMGPNGIRGSLCRIPVTSQFGDMIWKQHSGLLHDYVNCGGVNASALQFSLRDSFNKEVNLNAGGLSFTVLFTEQPVI